MKKEGKLMDTKFYNYKTLEGDTWDSIALDFYDEETLSGEIIAANLKYVTTIVFHEGINIKVPVIEKSINNDLPPWRK